MNVDDALLTKLEKLSYLKIDKSRRTHTIEQLQSILSFVENLSEIDTANTPANFAMQPNAYTPLRLDEPRDNSEIADAILSHAPRSVEHFFVVPKIIE
ncbi:MAG: glutamyl-tRNA amidotransferase [Sulfuricurvum sp. PC08-66]|nr:MAG: glutamyl-tRNA amidotransferase [Sulfuricurvum sp. PC08-66]